MKIATLFLLTLILSGCKYEFAPMRVEVRDRASHERVPHAEVRASNTHTLNPNPPEPAIGFTDADGVVVLNVGLYNALVIRVTPPDGETHVFSAEHPAYIGASPWERPIRTVGGEAPSIEIRLSPTTQLPEPPETQPATPPKSPSE